MSQQSQQRSAAHVQSCFANPNRTVDRTRRARFPLGMRELEQVTFLEEKHRRYLNGLSQTNEEHRAARLESKQERQTVARRLRSSSNLAELDDEDSGDDIYSKYCS